MVEYRATADFRGANVKKVIDSGVISFRGPLPDVLTVHSDVSMFEDNNTKQKAKSMIDYLAFLGGENVRLQWREWTDA